MSRLPQRKTKMERDKKEKEKKKKRILNQCIELSIINKDSLQADV